MPVKKYKRLDQSAFFLMALPGVLLLIVFNYLPMFGAIIAFKDYSPQEGILNSPWVGFKNFEFLFNSGNAIRITFNTVFLNICFIVSSTIGALILALCLNEVQKKSSWLAQLYQTLLFIPYFISYVVVAYLVFALLSSESGAVNQILRSANVKTVNWYAEPQWWPLLLTIVNQWKWVGFGTILYLAGLINIDTTYYEAASLEGASSLQTLWFITFPLLSPLITINILLQIGRIFFADFGLFYNVTRDSALLYPTTDVIDTFVFRALRTLGDFGMAGAAGLYQSLAGFIVVVIANWIVRRKDPERALF